MVEVCNMLINNLVGAVTASLALITASVSGYGVVKDYVSDPAIEGYGVYDKPVRAGETVPIEWHISKRTDCGGNSSRVWDGSEGFHMVEGYRTTTIPIGEDQHHIILTRVPDETPSGEVQLRVKGFYNCGGTDHEWFILGPVIMVVK